MLLAGEHKSSFPDFLSGMASDAFDARDWNNQHETYFTLLGELVKHQSQPVQQQVEQARKIFLEKLEEIHSAETATLPPSTIKPTSVQHLQKITGAKKEFSSIEDQKTESSTEKNHSDSETGYGSFFNPNPESQSSSTASTTSTGNLELSSSRATSSPSHCLSNDN